ncbi:MAG: flagellar biosynthesis GTPase FlhF [Bacteriovoracaceae bacterium]|jgi:flagellar biosynthesis GTPase FlhF
MYVQKFEADSLDEALKTIKRELGPDAIILKTVTNKGLKGAFKKKRIEVTAAISEGNYTSKAKVDSVLNDSEKETFYSDDASYIKQQIHSHNQSSQRANSVNNTSSTYGGMALNKQVKSVKDMGSKLKSSLDDFLSSPAPSQREEVRPEPVRRTQQVQAPLEQNLGLDNFVDEEPMLMEADSSLVDLQKKKIDDLERKLYELTQSVERLDQKEPIGVYELRTTLRSLDISDSYIQNLVKKSLFELDENQTADADTVFEFALREMIKSVNVEMPLFSTIDEDSNPAITVLVSDSSSGQTSMLQKIAALKEGAVLIRNTEFDSNNSFAEKVFGLNVIQTNGIAEIVGECRKAIEAGQTVFVDYKAGNDELNADGVPNQTKKFIDGLNRAFDNVEVLVTLSAIHSELYNRKVVAKYRGLSNGLVISHLDECLNFGALFNIGEDHPEQPFKFFGTGEVVPDDLESATAERILAGIFQFG